MSVDAMTEVVRSLSILLVEDSQDDIELTRIAFQSVPTTHIHVERDGQAALDFLFSCGTPSTEPVPDLVLLDLHLPKLDGMEVLKRIRASKLAALPIIVLSASGREEDVQSAYQNGANSYIQKPVEFPEFRHAVLVIHKFWREVARLPER